MISAHTRRLSGLSFLSAGLFAISLLAAGAPPSWESIGPEGGSIGALAVNPKNSSEVFAVTSGRPAQVFRTTDGAKSWQRVAILPESVFDLALDSVNPTVVYALGVSSVFRSTDSGASWTSFAQPVGSPETGGAIVVSPGQAGVLYAAGRKSHLAVAQSLDWGETWTLCCSGISPSYGFATCIAVNPNNGQNVLVGGYSDGAWRIYRTTNGGREWTSVVCPFKPLDIVMDPFNPLKALAATSSGVCRSTDGGGAWTRVNLLLLNRLAADPQTQNTFFGGYAKNSYRSVDGGTTWSGTYDEKLGSCTGLEVAGGQLCFASNLGLFTAPTSGGSWQVACAGLRVREIGRIAVCPTVPNIVFLTDKDDNLFRTDEFGDGWALVSSAFQGASLTGMIITPGWPYELYLASIKEVLCGAG